MQEKSILSQYWDCFNRKSIELIYSFENFKSVRLHWIYSRLCISTENIKQMANPLESEPLEFVSPRISYIYNAGSGQKIAFLGQ